MDHVTDVITFGAIIPCKEQECKNGNFVFDGNSTYRCTGKISAFGDCHNQVKEPERRPVIISAEILEVCPFLGKPFKAENRAIMDNPKSLKPKQTLKQKPAPRTNLQEPKYEERFVKGIC